MLNIEDYFKLFRKCFYRNKKDEYIILLNLKDKIVNIFNEDQHNTIYITLINLFLYQDYKFELKERLIDEIYDFKNKRSNFNVMKYSIISELILNDMLYNVTKAIEEYHMKYYNNRYKW